MSFFDEVKEEAARQDAEELSKFLDRWEPKHEGGRVRYLLTQMVFLGTAYFFLFSFLIPLVQTGSLAFMDGSAAYVGKLGIAGVCGYGVSYFVALYFWNHNEKRFLSAPRIRDRYASAYAEAEKPEKTPADTKKARRGGKKK